MENPPEEVYLQYFSLLFRYWIGLFKTDGLKNETLL